jgi:hypothetical protein
MLYLYQAFREMVLADTYGNRGLVEYALGDRKSAITPEDNKSV